MCLARKSLGLLSVGLGEEVGITVQDVLGLSALWQTGLAAGPLTLPRCPWGQGGTCRSRRALVPEDLMLGSSQMDWLPQSKADKKLSVPGGKLWERQVLSHRGASGPEAVMVAPWV